MAKKKISLDPTVLELEALQEQIRRLKTRCSKCFSVGPTTKGLCNLKCYPEHQRELALARVGREFVDSSGYTRIYVLQGDVVRMLYKHRVLKEEALGRPLTDQEKVIFRDNDRKNLELSNLVLALKGGVSLEDYECPHCKTPLG